MGKLAHRRPDISDRIWVLLKDRLTGREGLGGGRARDTRLFFWRMLDVENGSPVV